MEGARFIWNSRFFHIAKNNENVSKSSINSSSAQNLINYYGTRESVELNIDDSEKNLPVTESQAEMIDKLCPLVSNYKESYEYIDYINNKTIENASELITYLSEQLMLNGEFNEAENLLEYAGNRPGVVKEGKHGLFSSVPVDINEAKKEISTHEGNIWTHVLSLRREDAQKLGYENQKSWKNMIMENIQTIADAHNIKLENLRWYAAMHNTTHHPHVHLIVFSTDPNEGFFSQKKYNSLNMCKSKFANYIFKDELENLYEKKTELREEIKELSKIVTECLQEDCLKGYKASTKVELLNNFVSLSQKLYPNKKQYYGYLPRELKQLVDKIERTLINDNPTLSKLYQKWSEYQIDIEKLYCANPKIIPIEKNKAFNPIKNMIISSAQELRNHMPKLDPYLNNISYYKEKFNGTNDGKYAYRIAKMYNYGQNCDVDFSAAKYWYNQAQQQKIDVSNEQQELNEQRNICTLSIANCINHFSRIIDISPQSSNTQQQSSDRKLLQKERELRLASGQAKDDKHSQSFDY